MRRFKPGQRVVFDPKGRPIKNPDIIFPHIGEIITIKSYCPCWLDSYDIEGYEFDKMGNPQSINDYFLHPLVETRQHIAYKLSAPCPPELLNPNQLIELEKPQKV